MAWETRKGSGRYYTRSRRVNGRVVREYGGAGFPGECLELQQHAERLDRQRAQHQNWIAWDACQSATALLGVYCELVEVITRDALEGAGYHRHHRGEWRKRRGKETSASASAPCGNATGA